LIEAFNEQKITYFKQKIEQQGGPKEILFKRKYEVFRTPCTFLEDFREQTFASI
jgi:hypothetical protein